MTDYDREGGREREGERESMKTMTEREGGREREREGEYDRV